MRLPLSANRRQAPQAAPHMSLLGESTSPRGISWKRRSTAGLPSWRRRTSHKN